jgi:two-component system phosphate regulon response regulator PhoB
LFISAQASDGDRVRALELGADDYVAKPFSVREIVLRVRAMLRRIGGPAERPSTIGPLLIDRAAHRVFVHGRLVHLTVIELRLLCALCDGGARVQSREALLQSAWGAQRGVTVRTVDTHIKRLRKKLGETASYIRSVRGVGYGFDGPMGSAA